MPCGNACLQSALLQKGVPCETRQLPLGDMLWVARRKDDPTSEVLLGYIIERKTASDLASSIVDGRCAFFMRSISSPIYCCKTDYCPQKRACGSEGVRTPQL